MPGFTTHYLFGQRALKDLESETEVKPIEHYPNCFNIGLQGPDLFYFNPQAWVLYDHNIGDRIHDENVNAFFEALMTERDKFKKAADREICDSYILGFIGHYTLDTLCHPYIYYRTKHFNHSKDSGTFDFGLHVFLETDINNAVLRHTTHEKPSQFKGWSTIRLNPHEEAVLTRLLYRAIPRAFSGTKQHFRHIHSAFRTAPIVQWLLHDPTGLKKIGVRMIEGRFAGHAIVSSMVPNDNVVKYKDPCNTSHKKWSNPWDESITSTASIYDLMDEASLVFGRRVNLYINGFESKPMDRHGEHGAWKNAILNDLGNNSYCTGLDCSIPFNKE